MNGFTKTTNTNKDFIMEDKTFFEKEWKRFLKNRNLKEDHDFENDMDIFGWEPFKEEIKAIEKKFYKQGHSGMSAALASRVLSKVILNVLNHRIIHPIYSEEELQFKDAYGMIQSTVMYSVFKKEDGCTYQDAIVFIDQDGNSFRGSAAGINSSQYVKFPFYPKTFYIDVIKKDNEYVLKDKSQMDAVYEYYQKK